MNVSQNEVVAVESLEAREMFSSSHTATYHASAHRVAVVVVPPKPAPTPVKTVTVATPVTVTANGSTLTITGTTGNDTIVVTQSGNNFTVTNGTWSTTVTGSFTQIIAKGNGGNDSIKLDASVTVPATLYGSTGSDTLTGSNANDTFYSGTGTDVMVGGSGTDTFITLGSKGDTITGGAGNDSFWMDNSKTETVTDLSTLEKSAGHQHLISSFLNGASTVVGTGTSIADPTLTSKSLSVKNFSTDPLFGANGPSENDINQGYLGDCYFLSALSATAKIDPDRIRQSIVSLGDGTFAVQMKQANGAVGFVRIDADLATWGTNGPIAYANTGANSSLWVALLEKAFTYFRSGANPKAPAYTTIDNGGWMSESFNALGATNSDIYGRTAADLATQIANALAAGKAVTIGIENPPSGAPLIGDHAYTVDHVNRDANGNIVSVVLRNPWGVDGAGNDGNNDGYVTVTVAQLYAASMGGNAAVV